MENKDNIHLLLLVKVQFDNGEVRTLADMRKINFTDLNLYINFLVIRLGILADNYKDTPFSEIIFTYIIKDGLADDDRSLLTEQETHVFSHSYNNMQIPLTMNPSEYGTILHESHDTDKSKYTISDGNNVFILESDKVSNNVSIPKPNNLKWTDTKLSDNIFKREIMKDTLYVQNGEVVVKEKQLNAKPFKSVALDKQKFNNNSFMTIDIETVLVDNKQVPYLICGYSNGKYIHSYANDLSKESISLMFKEFIGKMLTFKSVNKVYAHNLSGFDGILLLNHLLDYEDPNTTAKPMLFNNKLISIGFEIKDPNDKSIKPKTRTIVFKDSLLMLPMSLQKLCNSFNVTTPKTNFPFKLTDINYKGEFPSFDSWTGLTQEQYILLQNEHGDKLWSFKDEAIKYCKIDCLALYDILCQFNDLVYSEFSLNIHNPLTLPALAMKIYKAHYMPKNTIYQMLGNVEKDIRESYTGGAVDVYITNNTYNTADQKLYYYLS
jgi:hypothetical protein